MMELRDGTGLFPGATRKSAVIAWLVVVAGCAVPPADQVAEDQLPLSVDTTVQRGEAEGGDRPDTVEGHLLIEGMREPMTFRLYRSPEGHPLPFSTYLPADIEAGSVASGEGVAVRFTAAFGGVPDEDAWLSFTVPNGDPDAAEARQLVRSVAESYGDMVPVAGDGHAWGLEEYRFQGARSGRVTLGRHDGTFFYIISRYPPEFGDGFGPRIARILGDWKWADGTRLGS